MELAIASEVERVGSLVFLLETFEELVGPEAAGVAPWVERLKGLQAGSDRVFRVAVAGAVKSGKSTLVNALVGRDMLKRGAGIVTSLVTRVLPGPEPRARLRLKGWDEVNREATDAALFLGVDEEARAVDLRSPRDRERLAAVLDELGERTLGTGGFLDRNVALLRAYLEGFEAVQGWVGDEPREVELGPERFAEHQRFAGHDGLAVYVDDLVLELPGLGLPEGVELGDCQGYDSPNPRHMEKVQSYLMGAHLVLYVVSSRVGLREADLRFVRDIRSLGLLDATRFVLNADLGEHPTEEDLVALADRVKADLRPLAGAVEVHTVSALRALLRARRERGEALDRKDELLLELWDASPAAGADRFADFRSWLDRTVRQDRQAQVERATRVAVEGAAGALRARVDAALAVARDETERLEAEGGSLAAARLEVESSLQAFESAVRANAEARKRELFRKVDRVFNPSGGTLAEEVLEAVRRLEPPREAVEGADRKRLARQMARVYQEMRASLQRHKVEAVNPRAVEAIRSAWAGAAAALRDAVSPPADLLVRSVEAYRREVERLGLPVPDLDVPELDPSIGRTVIPLFSAVTQGPGQTATDRVLSLAAQWTRKAAAGWARRLVGRKEREGFVRAMLTDGAEAVREVLLDEVRSSLLHYNEQVKHQVLGPSLDALADAWIEAYRGLVEAVVQDLEALERGVAERRLERQDLIPRLEGIRDALAPAAP